MAEEKDTKETIGYGNPPQNTRFKPGQSGNPKGRRRKATTFLDDVESELRSTISVSEDGKPRKRFTKSRAIAKQLIHLALRGDTRATDLLLRSMRQGHFDQPDKIDELLGEFRERNRRLKTPNKPDKNTSSGLAVGTPSTHTEDEKI